MNLYILTKSMVRFQTLILLLAVVILIYDVKALWLPPVKRAPPPKKASSDSECLYNKKY